jgi:heme-degrading monooxygenase HmoA
LDAKEESGTVYRHQSNMIARMWHGRTSVEKGEDYLRFLVQRAIPDYKSVPGNISVHILRRNEGGATHFLIVSTWESRKAIEAFAGEDIEVAKYYIEDADYLLEFEPNVVHYEIVAKS